MSLTANKVTAEVLFAMPDDGNRYELVRGELRMMSPGGGRHGFVAARLATLLGPYVRDHRLGASFLGDTGFVLARNPDTVRAPDIGFVTAERLATIADDQWYVPFAPDLAIEVVSFNDSLREVHEKAHAWLEAGTRLVLVVNPDNRTIHAYRSGATSVLTDKDILDGGDVVPGWRLDVGATFT